MHPSDLGYGTDQCPCWRVPAGRMVCRGLTFPSEFVCDMRRYLGSLLDRHSLLTNVFRSETRAAAAPRRT